MSALGPFAALDHVFAVEIVNGHDPELERLLSPLASDRPPSATYELALPVDDEPGWLQTPRARTRRRDRSSLHSCLVLEVGNQALASTSEPVVHGCLLDIRGRGVLVAGRSGRGKSTLSARLLIGGAALVTEDLTAIDGSGRARPYPRPVALAAGAFPALGRDVPSTDCGCGCTKHLVHPEELGGRIGSPVPVALVVLCDREGEGASERSLAWTLASLFDEASLGGAEGPEALHQVAAVLAGARCVVLGTRDLDRAAADIATLLDDEPAVASVAVERRADATVLYVDGEALVHTGSAVHHLDASATAVWILRTEGASTGDIAEELGWPSSTVEQTLERLMALELPGPVR